MGRNIISGERVGKWVANQLDIGYPSRSEAIGLEKEGEIIAGVLYENWSEKSIVCHVAITNRINKEFRFAVFNYAFVVCKVNKIIGLIDSSNLKAMRLVRKLGFIEEGRVKNAYDTGDMTVNTLSRANCRYFVR